METYVGHRYVPKIMGVWNKLLTYENLSIVTYDNSSYTSKTIVPAGVEISNQKYWVKTGDYNAQVEEFKNDFTAQLAKMPKDYPILNIIDFGADNTGVVDISDILHEILTTYDSAEIKFPAGIYYIDVNNRQNIGNNYSKSFIFKGDYLNTTIKINSYVGGTTYLSFMASLQIYDLIIDGMVNENRDVLKMNYRPYFSGVVIAKNNIFRNMNGNLEFNRDRKVVIENNIFDSIVDHGIYVRQTLETSSKEQELIIRGNLFKGSGNPEDYNSAGIHDPRHAIKIVGALNKVDILENKFENNFGDILIDQQDINMRQPQKVNIVDNEFFSSNYTIDLHGYDSNIVDSNDVVIKDNTFYGIKNETMVSKRFIFIYQKYNAKNLIIDNNEFRGEEVIATISTQDTLQTPFNIEIKNNTFSKTRIYMRGIDIVLEDNKIIDSVGFLDSINSIHFMGNTVIRGENIIRNEFGYVSKPLFTNNTFVSTKPFVNNSYIYGGMLINNIFKDVINIFNRKEGSVLNSMSETFIFSGNTLINSPFSDTTPLNVVERVNQNNNNILVDGLWSNKLQ